MSLCEGEKAVGAVKESMLTASRLMAKCIPFRVSKTVQCRYLG